MSIVFEFNPTALKQLEHSAEVERGLLEVAEIVRDEAQATAPYSPDDNQHFRDSFATASASGEAVVATTDPAGPYIELGTSDTPAHRTLTNALRAVLP